jgi:hypothetical protein
LPLWHVVPPLHTMLQPPQLALSLVSSTQYVPQAVKPLLHVSVQSAATQVWLPEQATPQAPQSDLLVCVSTHVPLQRF